MHALARLVHPLSPSLPLTASRARTAASSPHRRLGVGQASFVVLADTGVLHAGIHRYDGPPTLHAITGTVPFCAVAGPFSRNIGPSHVIALAETGAVQMIIAGRASVGSWRAVTQVPCAFPAPVAQILMSGDDHYVRDEAGRVHRQAGVHAIGWREVGTIAHPTPPFALIMACPGGITGWTYSGHVYSTKVTGYMRPVPRSVPAFYPVAGHVATSADEWMGPPAPSSLHARPVETAIHLPEMMDTMTRGSLLIMVVRGHATDPARTAAYYYILYTWEETAVRGHMDPARAAASYYARYNWEVSGDYRALGVYPLLQG